MSLPQSRPRFSKRFPAWQTLLVLAITWTAGNGWGEGVESFYQALANALENNPNMSASAASLRGAQKRWSLARASFLPQINLEAGQLHTHNDYHGLFKDDADTGRVGATLNQAVFNWQAVVAYRQAGPFVEAYAQDFESMRQNLTLLVVQEVIEWLQAREVLELSENNLRLTVRQMEATQARYTVGELTQTDVSQAQARVSMARAARINADNAMKAAAAKYFEAVGLSPVNDLALPVLKSPLLNLDLAKITELVTQRPDMEAARLRVEVAEDSIDHEAAGHLPVVNLSSAAFKRSRVPISGTTANSTEYTVGVTMTVPVFSGGATTAKTDQARADRDVQLANLDRLRQQSVKESTQAVLDIQSAAASVEALTDGVDATKAAMTGVEQEFLVGTRTSLDLLNAQNELFSAQTNLAKSRYGWELARYRLLKSVGHLSLAELGVAGD